MCCLLYTSAYQLDIQFIPYTTDERGTMPELTDVLAPTADAGTELDPDTDRLTTKGEYVVNVIAGELQLTKKLAEVSDEDQTFTFNITKDGADYQTITLTVPANTTEAAYDLSLIHI